MEIYDTFILILLIIIKQRVKIILYSSLAGEDGRITSSTRLSARANCGVSWAGEALFPRGGKTRVQSAYKESTCLINFRDSLSNHIVTLDGFAFVSTSTVSSLGIILESLLAATFYSARYVVPEFCAAVIAFHSTFYPLWRVLKEKNWRMPPSTNCIQNLTETQWL